MFTLDLQHLIINYFSTYTFKVFPKPLLFSFYIVFSFYLLFMKLIFSVFVINYHKDKINFLLEYSIWSSLLNLTVSHVSIYESGFSKGELFQLTRRVPQLQVWQSAETGSPYATSTSSHFSINSLLLNTTHLPQLTVGKLYTAQP